MWFSTLRQKFSAQSNTKIITERKQIQVLLSKIQKSRTHLTMKVKDRHGKIQEFSSFLVKIDRELAKPRLVFDELFPLDGNNYIKVNDHFDVYVESKGIIIEFSIRIIRIEEGKDTQLYYCEYPDSISHEQQRKAYRVQIANNTDYPVTLMSDTRKAIKGTLGDISNTGMRVDIFQEINPPLQQGEILQKCHITLDKGKFLQFSAQVKHLGTNRKENRKFVGLRFNKFQKNGDHIVNKLVLALQSQARAKDN